MLALLPGSRTDREMNLAWHGNEANKSLVHTVCSLNAMSFVPQAGWTQEIFMYYRQAHNQDFQKGGYMVSNVYVHMQD